MNACDKTPSVLVSRSVDELLQRLVRGEAAWFSANPAHGIRMKEAAHRLVEAKLARLIDISLHSTGNYVVIPPNAEWDFANQQIRKREVVATANHDASESPRGARNPADQAYEGSAPQEDWLMCHHPAYPDPLLVGHSKAEAIRNLVLLRDPERHADAWLLRTLSGGRVEYRGDRLRDLLANTGKAPPDG